MKITCIDAIMGRGKTSYAIQMMNHPFDERSYIYITPYLTEIERIKNSVVRRRMHEPNEKLGRGSKFNHLKTLISEGENIVTTHALFKYADHEMMELLKQQNYVLILDEVMSVVEQEKLDKDDKEMLINQGMIKIENNKVIWIGNEDYDGDLKRIKKLAENDNLYISRGQFAFWTFPYKTFELFDEVYIMTYLFNGQIQRYYYDYFNVPYEFKSVKSENGAYILCEYDPKNEDREHIKDLIEIYEDSGKSKFNSNYFIDNTESYRHTELSASWFRRADDSNIEQLQNNLYAFFRSYCKGKTKDNLWTTKKEYQSKLKGKGYSKNYTSLNLRATNDYKHTKNLAYVYNRYMNPIEEGFFLDRGIKINQDLLAISDLLQWIFRSQIRDDEPIKVYIPSRRMRELLIKYLNNEI